MRAVDSTRVWGDKAERRQLQHQRTYELQSGVAGGDDGAGTAPQCGLYQTGEQPEPTEGGGGEGGGPVRACATCGRTEGGAGGATRGEQGDCSSQGLLCSRRW